MGCFDGRPANMYNDGEGCRSTANDIMNWILGHPEAIFLATNSQPLWLAPNGKGCSYSRHGECAVSQVQRPLPIALYLSDVSDLEILLLCTRKLRILKSKFLMRHVISLASLHTLI
jgi:hypothetical protein